MKKVISAEVYFKVLRYILTVLTAAIMLGACGGNSEESVSSVQSEENTGSESEQLIDTFPRQNSLYLASIGTVPTNFNPLGTTSGAIITNNNAQPSELIYESLFAFNQVDGKLYGLIGKDYSWEENSIVVNLNKDAKWSDGNPLTANDVVYSYELSKKYTVSYSGIWSYLSSVEKIDDYKVKFIAEESNFNRLKLEEIISSIYILPQHIWEKIEQENGYDGTKLLELTNDQLIGSGPYKLYYKDAAKIVLDRNDEYWGTSVFGKLPEPKYFINTYYKDNASGENAFKAGETDISQQFITNIWELWEKQDLPIQTYYSSKPYYIAGTIPSLLFNTTVSGLDSKTVRKALAYAIDYDLIGQNAASGYTEKMSPSLMLATDAEQSLIDINAIESLQWGSADTDTANSLLDSEGWITGSDGIREKDGQKLSFTIECPTGWTDWQAAIEIVIQSAKAVGIELKSYYPDTTVYYNNLSMGSFDISLARYNGVGIANPWSRVNLTISSSDVSPIGQSAYSNYGRYSNSRADELLKLIANETDQTELKEYWTELNKIYLQDVPVIGLFYRTNQFYQVNTSVWDGFPVAEDGSNVSPTQCIYGYGIKALYNLKAK